MTAACGPGGGTIARFQGDREHARWCPDRHGGGLVEVEVKVKVKSTAGRRGITLPDQLFELIIEHCKRQDQEREHAGTEWHEGGWMFAQPSGKPIDPRRDQYEWKALLEEAGVREATVVPPASVLTGAG